MSATMAEEARAFRNATDAQYSDLVNGRITAAELIAANLLPTPTATLDGLVAAARGLILDRDGYLDAAREYVRGIVDLLCDGIRINGFEDYDEKREHVTRLIGAMK